MIPLRLEIKNFMAYRDADPIDFTGLHVVALTGDNGAGKSALLDAVTWALWGMARAKRDDELISQGATDMRVALTFSEGKHVYQVVRTRKVGKAVKGKAPTSTGTLEFFVKTADNGWNQITETRAAETQDKIVRTLNLTYDTFINSAYLKQGRADEFTLKPPAQRKELLAEILNLDIWQDYEQRAKDKLVALVKEQDKYRHDLEAAEQEIARLPEYEQQLEAAQTALQSSQQTLGEAEAAMLEIERQRERAGALRAQLTQAEARLRGVQNEMAALHTERAKHSELLAQYQSAITQRDEIERGFVELEQTRTQNETFNLKLSSMTELNARKHAAETTIADERRKRESEVDERQRRLRELQRLALEDGLPQKLAEVNAQLTALEASQVARDALQHDLVEAREKQGEARAQNEQLRREMNDLKTRIAALGKVGAICPTCGRELVEDDRVRLLDDWKHQGKDRGDAHRANEALMKQLTDHRAGIEARVEELTRGLAGMTGLQREQAALEDRLTKAQDAEAQLPEAETALAEAQAVLDAGGFAPEAQAGLAKVMDELAALGYDAEAHTALRQSLAALNTFAERKSQLDRAAIAVESEQRALQALALQKEALAGRQAVEDKAIGELRSAIDGCEQELRREPEVSATLDRARNDFFATRRKVDQTNQQVQSCLALRGTRDRLRDELDTLAREESLLDELRTAFGKNGVPAMVIESALPELEASANTLLGKMSNGRMNVRFETQRLTQKGEASETLEIRISDELGERAYEMYSGGEAFRVNFAIRIALSKLLAHRANAKLQTLFVDEGFGTQDAQGRERLVEAIKAIEDDFERIVVITHIDELRDAFPARIEVTKTAKGSVARVM
jgi:exonuclease SbcC